MVSVETWPSAADLQREIHGLADAALLGPEWHRSLGAWGGLKRRERLVLLGEPSTAALWIVARLDELAGAGILGAISRPGGSA